MKKTTAFIIGGFLGSFLLAYAIGNGYIASKIAGIEVPLWLHGWLIGAITLPTIAGVMDLLKNKLKKKLVIKVYDIDV